MRATVTFRGEEREVEYTMIEDLSVNHAEADWGFVGMTPDEHAALNITDEEEQAIFDQLWQAYLSEPDDDWPEPDPTAGQV